MTAIRRFLYPLWLAVVRRERRGERVALVGVGIAISGAVLARLDQANALAIANLLARLARESGTAVVCATHDPLVIDQADKSFSSASRVGPRSQPPK